jgi:uncharacterized membrane protein
VAGITQLVRGNRVESLIGWSRRRLGIAAVIVAIITFALSLEVDRIIETAVSGGGPRVWPAALLKQLDWTTLWTASGCALLALVRARGDPPERRPWLAAVAMVLVLLAAKFIVVDTIMLRLAYGPVLSMVVVNPYSLTACVVAAGLVAAASALGPRGQGTDADRLWVWACALIAVMIVAWGSIEIDRMLAWITAGRGGAAGGPMDEPLALSIYWSLAAALAVGAGFHWRFAPLRYVGLGLFALTLVKVAMIDMAEVGGGYRVLSFMALGALLVGTSVLYGRLSPRLLGHGRG